MAADEKVTVLDCITRLDIPIERVLVGAENAHVESAVVLGYDEHGDFFFSSSKGDGGDVLWLLELAKKRLLDIGDS